MVKQIQCYEDSNGKVHKDVIDAHRADLAIWLARSEAINETSARQLATQIINVPGELDGLLAVLNALSRALPRAAA